MSVAGESEASRGWGVVPRWHMAAWSEDVAETLLARRVADQPLLLFRKKDGSIAALADRCPHRFAPLSRGTRHGDAVHCGYHGLGFNAAGQCIHNPFGPQVPRGATVRTYPVLEQDGIVWVWPSDSAATEAPPPPAFAFLKDTPRSRQLRGYMLMKANFEYGTDNLMDLSHIEFVHRGSFAGRGVIFAGTHEVRQEGETLHSNWWMPRVPAPSHTMGVMPPDMITDHWLDMRWNAPASMSLEIGATPTGQPRAEGVIVHQVHILTPETEHTTHYYWSTTTALPLEDPQVAEGVRSLFAQAFDMEDKPMIEAAYANVKGRDFWSQHPVFLGVDAGGARARRLLEKLRGAIQA